MKAANSHKNGEDHRSTELLILDPQAMFRHMFLDWLRVNRPAIRANAEGDFERGLHQGAALKPDVIVLSANFRGFDTRETLSQMHSPLFHGCAIVLLDNDFNIPNLRAAIEFRAHGYWDKRQPVPLFCDAVCRASEGLRTFSPQARGHLRQEEDVIELRDCRDSTRFSLLTAREYQVAILTAKGLSLCDCAEILGVTESTIDNHKWKAMRKLGLHRTVEITLLAVKEGLLD